MPNWTNNHVIIKHDDRQKLIEIEKATKETGLFQFLIPPPDTPAYRDEYETSQQELHSDPTWWRNWNVNNWGTKWAIPAEVDENNYGRTHCHLDPDENILEIRFDSAWSPTFPIYEHLYNNGFEVDASFMEAGMDFWGWWVNGEEVEDGNMSDYIVWHNEDEWEMDEEKSRKKAMELGISEKAWERCELECIRGG